MSRGSVILNNLYGKFVWFAPMFDAVPQVRIFSSKPFGWRSEGMRMGGSVYHMVRNRGDGIGGLRSTMPNTASMWMSYLSVADVDSCVRTATAAVGRVLMPPTDSVPVGRGA